MPIKLISVMVRCLHTLTLHFFEYESNNFLIYSVMLTYVQSEKNTLQPFRKRVHFMTIKKN